MNINRTGKSYMQAMFAADALERGEKVSLMSIKDGKVVVEPIVSVIIPGILKVEANP